MDKTTSAFPYAAMNIIYDPLRSMEPGVEP